MKRGTTRNPKVYELSELLKCGRPAALGYLDLLWEFTADYAPQGDVGKYSDKRIEAALDWHGKPGRLISALVESHWLDAVPDGSQVAGWGGPTALEGGSKGVGGGHQEGRWGGPRLLVHHWSHHAEESVRRKLHRARLQFLEVTHEVTGESSVSDGQLPSSQTADSRLPLPLPLPKPLPEPEPEPGFDFPSWFEGRYAKHPKKKERGIAERYAAESIASGSLIPAEFDPAHDEWCATESWTWKNGAGAPTLAEFILDKGWKYPPQRAEPAPIDEHKRRFLEYAKQQEERYGSPQS